MNTTAKAADLTPEKAMEIAASVTGPEGFHILLSTADRSLAALENKQKQLEQQLLQAKASAATWEAVKKILQKFADHAGIAGVMSAPQVETNPETGNKEVLTAFDHEVARRRAEGMCVYRDRPSEAAKRGEDGWCKRKVRTKAEKQNGYCSVHMTRLGLLPKQEPTRPPTKPKKSTRKKKAA